MLGVKQEPVEVELGEPLGYVGVAEADEGSDDGLTLLQPLFKRILQRLTPVSFALSIRIRVLKKIAMGLKNFKNH